MDDKTTRQLIINLVNDYDDQGYILTEELVTKYQKKIEDIYNDGFEDGKQDMWGQIYDPLYKSK